MYQAIYTGAFKSDKSDMKRIKNVIMLSLLASIIDNLIEAVPLDKKTKTMF